MNDITNTPANQLDEKTLVYFLANEVVCGATKSISFDYLELLDKIFSAYEPPYPRHGLIGTFAAHRIIGATFGPTLNYLLEHKYVRATADNSKRFVLTKRGEKAQDKGDIKRFENSEWSDRFWTKGKNFIVLVFVPIVTLILLYKQTCNPSDVRIEQPIKVIVDTTHH